MDGGIIDSMKYKCKNIINSINICIVAVFASIAVLPFGQYAYAANRLEIGECSIIPSILRARPGDTRNIAIAREIPLRMPLRIENTSDLVTLDTKVYAAVFARPSGPDDLLYPQAIFEVSPRVRWEPGQLREVQLRWDIPATMPSGEYRVVIYQGLWDEAGFLARSFTDWVGIGSFDFSILGDVERLPALLPSSVVLGDSVRLSEAGGVVTDESNEFNVQFTIGNRTTEPLTGELAWTLYEGTAPFAARAIMTNPLSVKQIPGAERDYEISVSLPSPEKNYLVHLTGTLSSGESISLPVQIIGIEEPLAMTVPHIASAGEIAGQIQVCVQLPGEEIGGWVPEQYTVEVVSERSSARSAMIDRPSVTELRSLTIPANQPVTVRLMSGEYVYDTQVVELSCETCVGDDELPTSGEERSTPVLPLVLVATLTAVVLGTVVAYTLTRRLKNKA